MRFGVLDFSYAHFEHFEVAVRDVGCYTVNLGDHAQSIAARHVYAQLGIADGQVVSIDRDTLDEYDGDAAFLLMNGVFTERNLPAPAAIHPLFAGFHALEPAVARHRDWLRGKGLIGCRDPHTTALLRSHGIDAVTTGCATLALPRREQEPAEPRLFVVYGTGAGALPPGLVKCIPPDLANTAEFVFNRAPVDACPVPSAQRRAFEAYERHLFADLRDRATLVLTPLHHVAAPCMAMGIPVIVYRQDRDPRFSLLADLVPIHTPDTVRAIDWQPEPVDVRAIRRDYIAFVADRLAAAGRAVS